MRHLYDLRRGPRTERRNVCHRAVVALLPPGVPPPTPPALPRARSGDRPSVRSVSVRLLPSRHPALRSARLRTSPVPELCGEHVSSLKEHPPAPAMPVPGAQPVPSLLGASKPNAADHGRDLPQPWRPGVPNRGWAEGAPPEAVTGGGAVPRLGPSTAVLPGAFPSSPSLHICVSGPLV